MNWGTKIVIAFIAFIGVIATLVTISMRQDINLVAKDYYVQELAYQDQIERIENKNALAVQPSLNLENGMIKLQINQKDLEGTVYFFRPSDVKLDKKFDLRLDENGQQFFNSKDFKKGFWRVKVNWKKHDKEYYSEHSLVLR